MSDWKECRNYENCGGWLERPAQIESGLCENCLMERDEIVRDDEIATLRAKLTAAEARAERLLRGEFICQKCGLRKDGEHDGKPDF